MSVCKLCGQANKFIKAHSIPEAFFRQIRDGSGTPLLVSSSASTIPRRANIGVYDQEMLCEVCEPKFGLLDSYASEVLITKFDEHFDQVRSPNGLEGYQSASVNGRRLLQFLVSVLWRGEMSSQPFYRNIDLGAHEPAARQALYCHSASVAPVFDAVLSRWMSKDTTFESIFLDPRREKWSGVNAYRLYLGTIVAYVKVDSRPFPPALNRLSLANSGTVMVAGRNFETSKEISAMRYTVMRAELNLAHIRNRRMR